VPLLGLLALIVIGLLLLTKAADQLVIGAARVALAVRISAVVIGVMVAVGTTAPELVVSGIAAAQGSIDISIGNIIGSNVANLTLVLGTAALIFPVAVGSRTLYTEASISTVAVVLFAVLVQGGMNRPEAGVLLVALAGAVFWILRRAREGDPALAGDVEELTDAAHEHRLSAEILRTVLGLAGTLLGAQLLVYGAREIAERAGISEGLVGLTLVAVGTSLPELVTAIHAARRREHGLIIGTLLGANMLNSLSVSAVAGLLGPGPVDPALTGPGVVSMVAIALLVWVFMHTGRKVSRWEGAFLLLCYPAIVALVGVS
jgi:cation:H+ antiporter